VKSNGLTLNCPQGPHHYRNIETGMGTSQRNRAWNSFRYEVKVKK